MAAFSVTAVPFTLTGSITGTPGICVTAAPFTLTGSMSADLFTIFEIDFTNSPPYYYFTLTGAADGLADVDIPIKSFQCRLRSGDPTYLSVVIPSIEQITAISARSNGTMRIDLAYKLAGVIAIRETIVTADLEEVNYDEGTSNQSITLIGHKTVTFSPKSVTLEGVTYKSSRAGALRARIAQPNIYLTPGDTVTAYGDTFVANMITYMIGPETQVMEVSESNG